MLAAVAVVAIVGCSSARGTDKEPSLVPSSVANGLTTRSATAPPGFDVPGAQWISIDRPDGHTQLAAIFVPAGPGPFPTVVYLHGVSGLGRTQLQWLPRLADAGYLVLAGCYLDAADPTAYLPCDGLPPNDPLDVTNTLNGYDALVRTAHGLGAARPGPVGIVGVSFGAEVALGVADESVGAIVADSGYGPGPSAVGDAPVLLLGLTDDPRVPHDEVVAYEAAMVAAGKPIESHYYAGTGHVATIVPTTADEAIGRTIAFLGQHLKER
jgi:dienelactone hydrolase